MFLIVDGHSMIHRAHHSAGANLTSRRGEPTKATYTVMRQVFNLLDRWEPDFFCMAMDSDKRRAWRKNLYPAYKANRTVRSGTDDLTIQIKRIHQLMNAMDLACFSVDRWEADDIIATLVEQVSDFTPVMIVSRDKDLMQLLHTDKPWVQMWDHQLEEYITVEDVVSKFGVLPRQMIDYQMLVGDTSDNIPGCVGVGPKQAVKLLKEFGSVKGMVANVDALSSKLAEKVQSTKWTVMRQLVTLSRQLDLPDVEYNTKPNMDKARPMFRELGFKRWSK